MSRTNATLKKPQGTPARGFRPGTRVLSCATLFLAFALSSCVTRGEVRAYFYLNNGLPADLCEREPRLRDYGFYRRLNDGRFEFVSFCSPDAKRYLGILDDDLERLLDKTLPKENTP